MKETAFQKRCKKSAEKIGVDVSFYDDDRKGHAFHDDGTLHLVSGRGERACFDVSHCQSDDYGKETNHRTRCILADLSLEKFITSDVLVEETDGCDDDRCPHCGR